MVTAFGDRWTSIINAITSLADDIELDPSQVVPGSYTTMTIDAPAIVVYLEPYDITINEAGAGIHDRATCICFLLEKGVGTEQATISQGVDRARQLLILLQGVDTPEFPGYTMQLPDQPIKIDDVYETHAIVTMTFSIPL